MAYRMCEKSRSRCAILSRYKTSDCRGKSRSFRLSLICFEVVPFGRDPNSSTNVSEPISLKKYFFAELESLHVTIQLALTGFSKLKLEFFRICVLIVLTLSSLEVFSLIFRNFYSPILNECSSLLFGCNFSKRFFQDKSRQDIFEHLQGDPCQAPSVRVFFLKNHLCVFWSNLRN